MSYGLNKSTMLDSILPMGACDLGIGEVKDEDEGEETEID